MLILWICLLWEPHEPHKHSVSRWYVQLPLGFKWLHLLTNEEQVNFRGKLLLYLNSICPCRIVKRKLHYTLFHATVWIWSFSVTEIRVMTVFEDKGLLLITQKIYGHGEPWWNDINRGNRRTRREICLSATLSTTSPI